MKSNLTTDTVPAIRVPCIFYLIPVRNRCGLERGGLVVSLFPQGQGFRLIDIGALSCAGIFTSHPSLTLSSLPKSLFSFFCFSWSVDLLVGTSLSLSSFPPFFFLLQVFRSCPDIVCSWSSSRSAHFPEHPSFPQINRLNALFSPHWV